MGVDQQRDLLIRLNLYAKELSSLAKANLTVILGGSKYLPIPTSGEEYQYLDIYYVKNTKRNFLLGAHRLHKIIGFDNDERKVLIASNFSVDFLPLLILKLYNDFKIQISIHGYFSKFSPFFIFLRTFARYADSVRTVSESLAEYVIKQFKVKNSAIIIAPIPIEIPDLDFDASKKYDIIFLGRLHQERNLEEWVRIVKDVAIRIKFLKVGVAGDGEMRSFFESSLSEFDGNLEFEFLGYISHSRISAVLSSARILLSSAKSESYGLSIREAQLLGIKVLARRSEGAEEASKRLEDSIIIYDDPLYAVNEIARLLTSDAKTDFINLNRFRESVNKENQLNVLKLVRSWRALI
jgi:glycosyltransferase involved in cell wall biosynthesis